MTKKSTLEKKVAEFERMGWTLHPDYGDMMVSPDGRQGILLTDLMAAPTSDPDCRINLDEEGW